MAEPRRIRLSRARGWRLPAGAVNCARPTAWGNPFIVGQAGDRLACVHLHRLLLMGYLCLDGKTPLEPQRVHRTHVLAHLAELRGRDLACWCNLPAAGAPDLCHAATLLCLANGLAVPRLPSSDRGGSILFGDCQGLCCDG